MPIPKKRDESCDYDNKTEIGLFREVERVQKAMSYNEAIAAYEEYMQSEEFKREIDILVEVCIRDNKDISEAIQSLLTGGTE